MNEFKGNLIVKTSQNKKINKTKNTKQKYETKKSLRLGLFIGSPLHGVM